jgi:hypothetical protein
MEGYMRRLLTTITLGVGLTMGAAFAANATPSSIVIPGAHTTTVTTTTASTQPLASPSVPNATGSNSRRRGGGGSSGGGSGSGYRSSRNAVQSSTAGTWQKDAKGWWLSYGAGNYAKNTWVFKDDKWYYFDVEGYMLTSWRHINNNWYYMHDDGHMNTGWLRTENTHKWYFFDNSGAMWYNATTPDGYYVNNDGEYVAK